MVCVVEGLGYVRVWVVSGLGLRDVDSKRQQDIPMTGSVLVTVSQVQGLSKFSLLLQTEGCLCSARLHVLVQ